jgi:hypothetical protein
MDWVGSPHHSEGILDVVVGDFGAGFSGAELTKVQSATVAASRGVQHVFDLTPLLINAVEDAGFKERVPHVTDMILVIAAALLPISG